MARDDFYDYDAFPEAPEDYIPESEIDSYFLEAQSEIRELYKKDKESVYFIRQLQVKFEKKYYHWLTNNAITGLLKIGYFKDVRIPKKKGTSTRFFIHHANRYAKRKIKMIEKIVEEYSQSHITRSCGHRAEDLFIKALSLRGFRPLGPKVNDFEGKKWAKTGHDLDFIFSRDGVDYGCEIKNTLGYIDKEELDIKLDMCEHLGVKPLFIMRGSPKTYNKMIIDRGGFALIFEAQIYELSQEKLVKKMKEILGFPVVCSKAIPDGIIDRFEKWHVKNS